MTQSENQDPAAAPTVNHSPKLEVWWADAGVVHVQTGWAADELLVSVMGTRLASAPGTSGVVAPDVKVALTRPRGYRYRAELSIRTEARSDMERTESSGVMVKTVRNLSFAAEPLLTAAAFAAAAVCSLEGDATDGMREVLAPVWEKVGEVVSSEGRISQLRAAARSELSPDVEELVQAEIVSPNTESPSIEQK